MLCFSVSFCVLPWSMKRCSSAGVVTASAAIIRGSDLILSAPGCSNHWESTLAPECTSSAISW